MPLLVHGTAVVVGTTGLILIGPSGVGKSSLAVRLMAGASREAHLAALLSDDQVFLEAVNGHVIATAPASIKGMIELYGSGIGQLKTVDEVVLNFAVQPISTDSSSRIPEENQRWMPAQDISLPLYCMDRAVTDPFAWLAALLVGFPVSGSFQL